MTRSRIRFVVAAAVVALTLTFASTASAATTGQLWGSGDTEYGELGTNEVDYLYAFLPIEGLSEVLQASPGYYDSLVLLPSGAVEASGYNEYGELGDGSTTERASFAAVPGLSGVTAVAAGGYSDFALLSNSTVQGWGYNDEGEVGDGEKSTTGCKCVEAPATVKGVGGVGTLSNVVAISSGVYDGVALLSNGTVVDWGYGDYGELGDGSYSESDVPVQVKGVGGVGTLSNVVAISAGGYDNMALLSNGTVVAWGYGEEGELGDGEVVESDVPVEVKGIGGSGTLSGVSAISGGLYFNMALLSNGSVVDWGYNDYYELGDGNTTKVTTPQAVAGLSGVKTILAGSYDALALLQNGQLYGWGYGDYGELGDGVDSDVVRPQLNRFTPSNTYALEHGAYNDQTLILQGATASLSATSLAFSKETVGTTSPAQSVTLKNEGPAPLTVSGDVLTGSGSFRKTSDTCSGATLAAGATCSVAVDFTPTATGAASAALAFTTSAVNTLSPVELGGTGVTSTPAPSKAPELSALSLSKSTFVAASSGPSVVAAAHTGTIVSYTDSESATSTFHVLKGKSGVIKGHGKSAHCGKASKHAKGKVKRCTYYKAIGGFTHSDSAGKNSFRFTGRVNGKKLKAGRYRLVATARSSSGTSAQRSADFKIKT
jgi:alpha-tubulin suppressor-like RCC1 family protein